MNKTLLTLTLVAFTLSGSYNTSFAAQQKTTFPNTLKQYYPWITCEQCGTTVAKDSDTIENCDNCFKYCTTCCPSCTNDNNKEVKAMYYCSMCNQWPDDNKISIIHINPGKGEPKILYPLCNACLSKSAHEKITIGTKLCWTCATLLDNSNAPRVCNTCFKCLKCKKFHFGEPVKTFVIDSEFFRLCNTCLYHCTGCHCSQSGKKVKACQSEEIKRIKKHKGVFKFLCKTCT